MISRLLCVLLLVPVLAAAQVPPEASSKKPAKSDATDTYWQKPDDSKVKAQAPGATGTGTGTGAGTWADAQTRNAEVDLINAHTQAIKALYDRILVLEERVKQLELAGKSGDRK